MTWILYITCLSNPPSTTLVAFIICSHGRPKWISWNVCIFFITRCIYFQGTTQSLDPFSNYSKKNVKSKRTFFFFFLSRVFTYYGIKAWQTNESGYWFVDRILFCTKLTYTSKLRRNGKERNLTTTNRRFRFSHLYVATFQHNLHMKYIF